VLVDAEREGLDEPVPVLDWQPVVFAA
jgi:hypothetical protein